LFFKAHSSILKSGKKTTLRLASGGAVYQTAKPNPLGRGEVYSQGQCNTGRKEDAMQRIGPVGPPPRNELMAFIQAFFDESGKYQQNKVVSFCGFADSDWGRFQDEWLYLLRHHRIPHLHLSKDDLKATASRMKMYERFMRVIKTTVAKGFGIAVHVPAFMAMHRVARASLRNDPHYMAFYTVLRDVVKYASILPDPTVSIVCDDEPSKACECYKQYDVMRQNIEQSENRKVLKSIAFADAKYYIQLQAADLYSWVCRAESLYQFFGDNYSLRELLPHFSAVAPEFKLEASPAFWSEQNLKDYEKGCLADKTLRKMRT
jgi:hypothetical protein